MDTVDLLITGGEVITHNRAKVRQLWSFTMERCTRRAECRC